MEQRCAIGINQRELEDREVALLEFRDLLGARFGARRTAGYWDADHVTPVVIGGGECGLDGYRILCIPCHKLETALLKKRLASSKNKKV